MGEMNRILLATDFSETAEHALQHARLLSQKFGAELHVLYVHVEPVQIYGVSGFAIPAEPDPETEQKIQQRVEQWCGGQAVKVAEMARDYSVPMAIRHYAEDKDIDLIVMGTHGRKGASRFFLGSVAAEVVRTATTPVLVVGEAHKVPQAGYANILTAIDFSEASLSAFRQSVHLAEAFGASLKALHVVDSGKLPPYYPDEFASIETAYAESALRDLLSPASKGLKVDESIIKGDPHEVIVDTATEEGSDLVVMGTAGLRGVKALLVGSVADRVLRTAPCPVLVMHNPLAEEEEDTD